MSSTELPIKRIGGSGRANLKLEGTVLIYNEKHWCYETTLLIPVETIETSECSRFYKDLVILAIVVPVIAILLGLFMYLSELRGDDDFGEILIILDDLLNKIKEQQNLVKETQIYLSEDVYEISDLKQVPRLFLTSCLFCIPAVVLEKPSLLFLALIPIALYIWRNVIKLRQHPKKFRQALARYKHKDWKGTIEHLKNLLEHSPEYIPAMFMLAETYVRSEQFNEAINITAQIPEEYLDERNDLHLTIWKFKRIYLRRKENNLGDNMHEP
jgi:hypothetical protein